MDPVDPVDPAGPAASSPFAGCGAPPGRGGAPWADPRPGGDPRPGAGPRPEGAAGLGDATAARSAGPGRSGSAGTARHGWGAGAGGPGKAGGGQADAEPGAWFGVLGPLAGEAAGGPLPLGPLKQRLVLALLLCRAGSPVSVDLLTEAVWPDEPPRTARKNLQVYVSALRKLFGTGDATGTGDGVPRVVSQPAGYLLTLPPDRLDALRFRALVRDGRAAAARGEPARAAALLRAGLDLWRGAPLSDLRVSPPLRAEARRLAGDRVAAYEEWAEAELRLGNAHAVAEGIAEVAERHPQRERLQATRMSALHQCGRRAEALGVYDELRQWLARELGLAVSPRLETLYRSILADGPAAPPPAPEPAATGALLPADLADFTGRAEESALLEKVLPGGRGRTVLLVGPSGVGKTALAVHGAHRLGEHFPDGRLLVGLRTEDGRPRPAASVLGEIVRTAGLAARVPADPARAAALCRAWLTGHRVLLVLDDAPDEALARQLLPCGGRGGLLVTARAQLAGLTGVERVAVPPMAEDEALQLLGRIIGEERLARDRAAARRIVGACGALPLAVRVAGMRLAVLRHLPLAEYAGRLAETGATLEELAAGDVAVRPRLDVCWQDLADGERGALLRLTGLPPGAPFTLGQAATALDSGAGRAQHVLERLIETGAVLSPQEEVAAHAARYTVPYLLHLYARERRAA